PVGKEGAEALPGIAAKGRPDRVLRQTGMTVAACDLARQHCADSAMNIADGPLDAHRLALLERRLRLGDQLVVERFVEKVVLPIAIEAHDAGFGRLQGLHTRAD